MRIAIIQFPGSNCEAESIRAVRQAGLEPIEFLWNHDPRELEACDGYFIVGGFSYEDRSRAGIIAALDPIMNTLKQEVKKGKPVLGVCNGAQILVETGLVPGLKNHALGLALAINQRLRRDRVIGTGFYNTWVNIKLDVPSEGSAFTRHLKPGARIRLPIAHAEGRFVIPEPLLQEMKTRNLTAFRYCDENGDTPDEFPTNPNGAVYNLAAITNPAGTALAMMPHPERTEAGQPIFTSLRDYIASYRTHHLSPPRNDQPLTFVPRSDELAQYQPPPKSVELTIELTLTDNELNTVRQTLAHIGIHVNLKRYRHWEITLEEPAPVALNEIIASGELFNAKKDKLVDRCACQGDNTACLLIQDRSNIQGHERRQTLTERLGIGGIKEIRQGTLWQISIERGSLQTVLDHILDSQILFNPYAQEAFYYQGMNYTDRISRQLNHCLIETNLPLGKKYAGKVRDRYDLGDKLILVTTDRQSAFDRVLASIPYKGQVLNQISAWWFDRTRHIIPNHLLSVPDPNVTVVKNCTVFPVEFVVRGYITGTTSTSAWVNYNQGVRDFCGQRLPAGLRKNQKFDAPIITPTTKDDKHDRLISPAEIVSEGILSQAEWDYTSKKAFELFTYGQTIARTHGLILVDTKYEFGKDGHGVIRLVDELHTPDSSRYWIADTYEERFAHGEEPENIDKEFLRLWFSNNCDPYHDPELPPAPKHLVIELSRRYIQLYEMITGQNFMFPDLSDSIQERIENNLLKPEPTPMIKSETRDYPLTPTPVTKPDHGVKCILILGSDKDQTHAKKITDELNKFGIQWEQRVASAHKQGRELLAALDQHKEELVIYITIAGRSNALSGFVAGNTDKVTIACPPFVDKADMMVNIHSTIQMPNDVPVMTILEPKNTALAIKRIIDMQKFYVEPPLTH